MSRVRDHWSIGEVLSLLQDEFPEVTISKIRFLESQGLIDPERTPSGYRKFSDGDYDRLYWILEQQRDNYLPLRVIRDRLDEGQDIESAPRRSDSRIGDELPDGDYSEEDLMDEPDEGPVLFDGDSDFDDDGSDEAPAEPKAAAPGPSGSRGHDQRDTMFRDALAENEGPLRAADPAEDHPVQHESENALTAAVHHASRQVDPKSPAEDDAAVESSELSPGITAEEAEWVAPSPEAHPAPEPIEDEDHSAHQGAAADSTDEDAMNQPEKRQPAPRLLGTRTEGPKPVTKSTAEVLAPPPRPTLPGSSVALTREELAEQSGCTPGMVTELEKHGLVSPRNVAGAILFDSTALTLARLAVQFGRYGLEPRHLRTFRLGAEREVALLTQSIGPTLKANNPETRRRSFDTLQDLAELSASLRSIIVRDLVADLEPGG